MGVAIYVLTFALLVVGIYTVVAKRNLIKIILGVLIIHNAINMFLVLLGYRAPASGQAVAPILTQRVSGEVLIARSVDPVPQALVLTSIVIGLAVIALIVVTAVRLYDKYGTFDLTKIRKLRG